MRKRSAFTLVEMLFVVIIAAGVMMFAMPAYKKVQERSRYNVAVGLLQDYGTALLSMRQEELKCPFGGKIIQIKGSASSLPARKTLKDALGEKENDDQKNNFCLQILFALYEKGAKIGPEDTDYNYFLVYKANAEQAGNFAKPGEFCRQQCVYEHPVNTRHLNTDKVLACMCSPENEDNRSFELHPWKEPGECFLGAKIMLDGTVERIVNQGCTSLIL